MNPTKRNYRATFILDNRGREETVDQLIEGVKQVITDVKGEVTAVDNIGRKDFVRVTDKKLTGANYVHVNFSAPPETPANLLEKLRLNGTVYRTFIQSV
ncbi:MAG: 30S ribosomal protein S6 [Opitutaceae bacterium]